MLTPTDIHYLVGLLTRASDGNDVEIELGDMVFDEAAEKERDVDITVTKKNLDGTTEVYRGIEVKDHRNPLDVIHVEQLCAKMADMPSLTSKSIVSASGYTRPAVLKANKHGVELLEIVEWEDTMDGFDYIRTEKDKWILKDIKLNWIKGPRVQFILQDPSKESLLKTEIMKGHPRVCDGNGNSIPNAQNMMELSSIICNSEINKWLSTNDGKSMPLDQERKIEFDLKFEGNPQAIIGEERISFSGIFIEGIVSKSESLRKGEFKILRKVDEKKSICCCVIYDTRDGHLSGMAMSNTDMKSRGLFIPFKDRVKQKIKQQKI